MKVDFYENPYAFNFYKIDLTDFTDKQQFDNEFKNLKNNSVLTVKVTDTYAPLIREVLDNCENIVQYRIIIDKIDNQDTVEIAANIEQDHLKMFYDFVIDALGDGETVLNEL